MSTVTVTAPITAGGVAIPRSQGQVDSRAAYTGFALAYVFGHGAAALSKGAEPLMNMPGWLPTGLLGTGLVVGTACAIGAAARAQRGAAKPDILSGQLLGASWAGAFIALFIAITGLTSTLGMPELQSVLWPTGSGLVVGLLYLGEGAVRRNLLHYSLGTCLALISAAALFFSGPGLYWVLAIGGGGAFAIAAVLERHRLAARGKHAHN